MKVLIVDDSKAMRMILARALRRAYPDSAIIEAANGPDALALLQSIVVYLVLCDWNMPEMSGLALLQELTKRGIAVKFRFVTSEATAGVKTKAMEGGALFVITKPFTSEALAQHLAAAGVTSKPNRDSLIDWPSGEPPAVLSVLRPETVASLLTSLLGRDVTARQASMPWPAPLNSPVSAIYRNDQGEIMAVLSCDLAFAAKAAAALTLIPPSVAAE